MSLSELKNIIEKNISNADISLRDLKLQQKSLNDNAEKLKFNVKESIELLCLELNAKKKQLIRQVDFVTAHQKSLLDAQITNGWFTKGSLTGTQDILSKCTTEDIETLVKIQEKLPICLKPVLPIKMITVKLEPNPVSLAIEKFAEAHLPSTIMHYDSPVVPAKTEDYGDSEQDVLHKSLDQSTNTSSICINVKFPKLPSTCWLAAPIKAPDSTKPNLTKNDTNYWLSKPVPATRDLSDKNKMDNCRSEDEDSEHSFQLLDVISKQNSPIRGKRDSSLRISEGSSIEVLPLGDYEKDYFCCGYDFKNGLSSPHDSQISSPTKLLTIEDQLCCQANEPCASYAECVVDRYCKNLANEKVLQTNKWLEKSLFNKSVPLDNTKPRGNKTWLLETPFQQGQKRKLSDQSGTGLILKHMKNILSSDSKLWLSKCSVSSDVSSHRSKITFPSKSNESWLSSPSTPSLRLDNSMLSDKIWFSPKVISWISSSSTSSSDDRTNKPKYQEEIKETKDNKNSSEQQKNGFQLSVEELKGAINQIYETTKYSPSGLFRRKENEEFWLSNKEELIERKLQLLSVSKTEVGPNLFPPKYGNDNNLDKWLDYKS